MSVLPIPVFVEADASTIQEEMIAFYENATGKTLRPGQPETLLINALAYREFLFRYKANEAAKQNLVAFAKGPILDYLAQLVGVERLPASYAVCTLELELVDGHGPIVIPAGLRVASTDGRVVFATDVATEVDAGIDTVTVEATCVQVGSVGNAYAPGTISTIQDPQPYLSSAMNTQTTNGGGNAETDDQIRARIKLAPSIFSVAGPSGAYEYWAKTASPNIVDVKVRSVVPGRVEIFPLMESGETPDAILSRVFEICDNVKVRPLTDTVQVLAPAPYEYELTVNLTLLPDADQDIEYDKAMAALTAYKTEKRSKLGLDLVQTKIKQALKSDGLYDAAVVSPASNVVLDVNQYAECLGININFVGISEP
jgi:phage-related baseplate assembly protein